MTVLGFLFWLIPVLDVFRRCLPLFFSELVALSHISSSFSPEHFNLCYEKGKTGDVLVPFSTFHICLQLRCNTIYGPLYLSLVVLDENAFHLALRIPVFLHTAT